MLFLPALALNAQFERVGAGLSFSSGVDLGNYYKTTGNPGLWAKASLKAAPKFYISPSITVFNRYRQANSVEEIRNYMFHGDLDASLGILREGDLRVFGFAGLNATAIASRYENFLGLPGLDNKTDLKLGLNLGGTVEMKVDDYWDAILTGKIIAGQWTQIVLSIGVVYVFEGRFARGWR